MDRVEHLVRAELARRAGWPQPDPDRMLARVHRRRRWLRALVATALAAVLAGAGAAVVAGAPGPRPDPPPSGLLAAGAYAVDTRTAFVVAGECGAIGDPCRVWLAGTVDGGSTWTLHRTPVTDVIRGAAIFPEVYAWDAHRVVIESRQDVQRYRYFSADGGATWQSRERRAAGTIDSVPPGSRATVEDGDGADPAAVVVLRPDGFSTRLANQPPSGLSQIGVDLVEGTDGSLWLRGGDERGTDLVVSRDRGRTWTGVAQPAGADGPATGPFVDWFDTADGRTVYLYDNRRRLWRQNLAGGGWQRIEVPEWPTENPLVGVATPDGGLIVNGPGGGRLWTLAVGGTLLESAMSWPVRSVIRRGSGCLGWTSTVLYLSPDCRTWTPVQL